MRILKRSSRVLGLSLNEVALLLVFLLLALLASSNPPNEGPLAGWSRADLENYRENTASALELLNVSPDGLREIASRLIAADLVDQSKLSLSRIIDELISENKTLRADLAAMEKRAAGLLSENEKLQTDNSVMKADADELARRIGAIETELKQLKEPARTSGTEPGSCWFDSDGREDYFLELVLNDEILSLRPVWPANRSADLKSMGIDRSTVPSGEIDGRAFSRFARPIYVQTIDRGCRLFVRLIDKTTHKKAYKRNLRLVERYFFVHEIEAE